MVEVYTSSSEEHTAWQPAPADKELEAEMLTRLSLRLENDFNPKQKTREEIEKQPALQKAAPVYVSREIKGPKPLKSTKTSTAPGDAWASASIVSV
jgi:outer membrane protein assembly factor BamC